MALASLRSASFVLHRHFNGTPLAQSHDTIAAGIGIEFRVDRAIPATPAAAFPPSPIDSVAPAFNSLVFQAIDQHQIFDAVVEFVAVDVVQFHARWHGSVVPFPHDDMLKSLFAILASDPAITEW